MGDFSNSSFQMSKDNVHILFYLKDSKIHIISSDYNYTEPSSSSCVKTRHSEMNLKKKDTERPLFSYGNILWAEFD